MKHFFLFASLTLLVARTVYSQTYCKPTVANPQQYYIKEIYLNINPGAGHQTENISTTSVPAANGYSDLTGPIFNSKVPFIPNKNLEYTLTIFSGSNSLIYVNMYAKIWIDLNQDGDFFDPNENVKNYFTTNQQTNGGFTLFLNAITSPFKLGPTRMRVSISTVNNGPCDNFQTGAYQDFTVNIVCPTPNTPTITGSNQICSGGLKFSYGLILNDLPYSNYTWSLTNQGTNPIVLFTPNDSYTQTGQYPAVVLTNPYPRSGSFSIQVQGQNSCGAKSAPAYLNVYVDAAKPGTPLIQGPASVAPNATSIYSLGGMTTNVNYSITPSSSYASVASSVYGQLTVKWSSTFAGASINATVTNGCGTSNPATKTVGRSYRIGDINDNAAADRWNVVVYPNISDQQSSLVFNNAFESTASVEIYDGKGVLVYSNPSVDTFSELLIGENYAPGIYNVKVNCGGSQKFVRMAKSN